MSETQQFYFDNLITNKKYQQGKPDWGYINYVTTKMSLVLKRFSEGVEVS